MSSTNEIVCDFGLLSLAASVIMRNEPMDRPSNVMIMVLGLLKGVAKVTFSPYNLFSFI